MQGPAEQPTDSQKVVAYFGYGSLVCRRTHRTDILAAVPARLSGWRRIWRPRPDMPGFPAALLSVMAQPDAGCDGLLVFDRAENLPAVDAREARYSRVALDAGDLTMSRPTPFDCPIWLYVADEHLPPHREAPLILRSYLDAVMEGFLTEHGEDGLRRFVEETDGFDIGIHDDRTEPIYPRALTLTPEQQALFARALNQRGID